MSIRRLAAPLGLALICIVSSHEAKACACCANSGQRLDTTAALRGDSESYELNEVKRIVFGNGADLFVGEGEPGDVKGLDARTGGYELAVARDGDVMTMSFKDQGKVAGTLSFPLANARLHRFEVDPRRAAQNPTEMISLYKEWTLLSGSVKGTGMFKLSDPSTVQLILQGHGNSCSSAEDFTHWTLRSTGREHDFSFIGKLEAPN
jgi:hypothetical protein